MASTEEGSKSPAEKKRSAANSMSSSRFSNSWLGRNWQTVLIIVLMVFLAFFVRTYFGYSTSVDNGFLVSGGSDSYYHERVIDHVASTGEHIVRDPMLNYPLGIRNERPPLYDWSVAVSGMSLSAITGMSTTDGLGFALVFSTAFWGALTVIPVYLLGRAAFGKKAGVFAAFLFALMPGAIERTMFSNADHDAMVLFFVVTAFYFLLRSLQSIKGEKWVTSWRKLSNIRSGMKSFASLNAASMIYAALAGVCVSVVAMIWTGYTYILVIVGAYLIVQLLIDRFRNADSLGVVASFAIMFGVAFMAMTPLYIQLDYVNTWLDTPLELYLVAIIAGLIFVVTRDYPWTLTLPVIALIAVGAMVAFYLISPNFFNAIASGQGYLVKSKLYSTISEATAPSFSTLALSFGAVTFWLALFGVGYAATKIPKNVSPHLVFIVVWAGVSIYMASSAGRFVFNATPAFAVLAGWILILIIERAEFSEFFKSMVGSRGSLFKNLRKSVKFRHIFVGLIVFGLILLPSVWTALDAGIPNQSKKMYDRQIYDITPDFLKPSTYDTVNGTYWYLGGFSYDLPLPSTYYPQAWSWFSEQDVNLSEAERPAYISWWDYGFEAVRSGGHPTIADNFQNGYSMAGSFLMCSNETGAIALMVTRILEKVGIPTAVEEALVKHDVNVTELKRILTSPSEYISIVASNPSVYGPYASDLSASSAKYAAARVELSKIGMNELTALYHEIRGITGYNIGYFAVDSRLFPFSATSQNIFYAPAKLSDQVIDPYSNAPTDYYVIKAVDNYGNEHALQDVTSDMVIVSYSITYTTLFYNTMLYRAFMGYGPYDVGLTYQGLPGISGSLYNYAPMQGWNMSHFRMVYRTAYYNQYSAGETANHSADWVAISYETGQEYQALIAAGKMNGTVDLSAGGLYSGVVFLQYYDGANITGRAVSKAGEPMANIYVTVLDDNRNATNYPYGIPHQTVKTDANGYYTVIAPFGNTTVVYSYGTLNKITQIASTVIDSKNFPITYAQAMGATGAEIGSGYVIDGNITLDAASVNGKVFWDIDGDSTYDAGTDVLIVGANVVLENTTLGYYKNQTSTENGYYFGGLSPASVSMYAVYQGHTVGKKTVDLNPSNGNKTIDIAVKPAQVKGVIKTPSGEAASGVLLNLVDTKSSNVYNATTDANGQFAFTMLYAGNYTLKTADNARSLGDQTYSLTEGEVLNKAFTVYSSMNVIGQVRYNDIAVPYAQVEVRNGLRQIWTTADMNGNFNVTVPKDNYTVYAIAVVNGNQLVYISNISSSSGPMTIGLISGNLVNLQATSSSTVGGVKFVITSKTNGATIYGYSNATGAMRMILPNGDYSLYAYKGDKVYWSDIYLASATNATVVPLDSGATISGTVWADSNFDGVKGSTEGIGNVTISVTTASSALTFYTEKNGTYKIPLVINGTYSMTVSYINYVSQTFSFPTLNASIQAKDVKLVPQNRTVSLNVVLNGSALTKPVNVTLTAVSKTGAITISGMTSSNGTLALSVRPGKYIISIDENVTDNASYRYQLDANVTLTVSLGHDATVTDLTMVERVLVTGTVPAGGIASITFNGIDVKKVSVPSEGSYRLYLQKGNYSVYCDLNFTVGHGGLFNWTMVNGPSVFNIETSSTSKLNLQVMYEGKKLNYSSLITLTAANGAKLNLTTGTTGALEVYLPYGQYGIVQDVRVLGKVGNDSRYLKYHNETSVAVSTLDLSVDLAAVRTNDNSTVTGTISTPGGILVAGNLCFMPETSTAMWANVTSTDGNFSKALAPGTYSVYANGTGLSGVYLGKHTVTQGVSGELDIQLVEGVRYFGTTTASSVPVMTELRFTGVANMTATSAADGTFAVYLPSGSYWAKATAYMTEQGIGVAYSKSFFAQSVISDTIDLDRVNTYGVSVTWNSSERVTLNPNETATYNIIIKNTGNRADTYTLSTTAVSGWNATLSVTSITLDYGTNGVATIQLMITPGSSLLVTQNSTVVKAVSTNQTAISASVTTYATLVPHHGVNASRVTVYPNDGTNYRYEVQVNNLGNIDDKYSITIANMPELVEKGWNVTLRYGSAGTYSEQLNITVTGGKSDKFEVAMIDTMLNPNTTVTVVLHIQSVNNASTSIDYPMVAELPNIQIPSNGLTVAGGGVSTTLIVMPLETILLFGTLLVLFVLLVVLSIKKGVFTRRKR